MIRLYSICFVLPKSEHLATGGYKIVYEYANRLVARGYQVSVLYLNSRYLKRYPLPRLIKKLYFQIVTRREPVWFALDHRVKKISNYSAKAVHKALSADVAIATAVATAPVVKKMFLSPRKAYLIQGYEVWNRSEDYVHRTYALGLKNIAVSSWLKRIVDRYAKSPAALLPNPIDLSVYSVRIPLRERLAHSLAVLYNPNPCKGFEDALQVLLRLRKRYGDLKVHVFGAYPRPAELPSWIEYTENATQQETVQIYNHASVYLCASREEGFGLTGLEAMACGCALSSTAFEGALEYGVNEVNCLFSTPGDVDALFDNTCRLIENSSLREQLSGQAQESVKAFSWDRAIERFEEILIQP